MASCTWRCNKKFFNHVTNSVVVAVTEGDMGAPQVEEMLARLTSWQVSALEKHMEVTLLASGSVTLQEGGVAVHEAAMPPPAPEELHMYVSNEYVWSVFSLNPSDSGRGLPLHLYAALNVGREGWCVLTSDFHTLVHVLRGNGMEADFLTVQDSCVTTCSDRRDDLVPRTRAGLLQYPSIRRPRSLRWHKYIVKKTLQLACMMLAESSEAMLLCDTLLVHYLSHGDPEAGWVLVAGFDMHERKHRAAGRTCFMEKPLEVVCEERDIRGFLEGVRPVLRRCGEVNCNSFLRNFTRINPVRWEEAAAVLAGEWCLKEAAYRRVCELPLQYLQQHAPHALYSAVSLTRAIVPWTPEHLLKGPEDIA